MSRFFNVAIMILALISGAALYQINHKVQQRLDHLAELEAQIERESEAIRVLKAEWAYLTDPTRLKAESVEHLPLRPTLPDQVASSLAAVPFRGSNYALASADGPALTPRPRPRSRPSQPTPPQGATVTAKLERADAGIPRSERASARTREDAQRPATDRRTSSDFTRRVSQVLENLQGGER